MANWVYHRDYGICLEVEPASSYQPDPDDPTADHMHRWTTESTGCVECGYLYDGRYDALVARLVAQEPEP